MALVELPAAKLTELALSVTAPALTLPLLVIVLVANNVKVFELELAIETPEPIDKLPDTATVTLAVVKDEEIALATPASKIKSLGSSNQLPILPRGADTVTTADFRTLSVRTELVSTKPPLPPKRPPVAMNVPATFVC